MANRRIEFDVIANDKASGVFSNIRTNGSSMASRLTNALGGTVNAIGSLDNALRSYNNGMYGFNRTVSNITRVAGKSIYDFTKDAINNFSEFERQHAKTMGAIATEYDKTTEAQEKFLKDSAKLKQQALNLGTYGVGGKGSLNTVTDISYAQTALVKAGVVKDNNIDQLINSGAVESILKFAGGNDLDIDTATTFAVNLATVFNKPIEEWGKMLDMVTKAADISVIDVPDIMDSLTYTGGIASGLGRDLEEVLGVISIMGQAGLRGRVAGTGLQAFFTRILSSGELTDKQIENAPTPYVGQIYNAFIGEATNADGSFKAMDEVASLLDTAMESLNDQEQAWFAKKLFGLYQMKAAYALTGAVDGDQNTITDFIGQITSQSEGTNDIKYNLSLASQYGKLASLKNVWEGTKTDFGSRLSPIVSTVADELFKFLEDPNNYKINWDTLRNAISESGDLIGEKYGEQLGQIVKDIGNFGIDASIITGAIIPEFGGIIGAISKLAQGDIAGAIDEFAQGIGATNENIEGLPEELKGAAEGARDVIAAFAVLSGINLATKIVGVITTAFNMFLAKPIKWALGKINSTKTDVTSTTTAVNASSATVNIGSVSLMNVTATVVNVYGGGNPGNPGNPTSPTSPTQPPLLQPNGGMPSGTPPLLLPSGSAPTGGSPTLSLPPGSVGPASAAGKATTLYKVGNSYKTGSQIPGMVGKGIGMLGNLVMVLSLTGSESETAKAERQGKNTESIESAENEFHDRLWDDNGFILEKWHKIETELSKNGKLSERFLYDLVTYTASDGTYLEPSSERVYTLLHAMFEGEFKKPWIYGGSLPDEAITKYIKDQINKQNELPPYANYLSDGLTQNLLYDIKQANVRDRIINPYNSTYSLFHENSSAGKFITDYEMKHHLSPIFKDFKFITDKIQSQQQQPPVINVNVTNNVDKSGNVTTKVTKDINNNIIRRSSQYGQTLLFN